MPLTKLEREIITDSMLKIQSVQASLDQIDETKLADGDEIQSCLKSANNSFRAALKTNPASQKQSKQ